MEYLLLAINPGSTSTKIALFLNDKLIQETVLRHDKLHLSQFHSINDQLEYRKDLIIEFLKMHHYKVEDIDVFVGRGGMLKPLKQGGAYLVNAEMLADLKTYKYGAHASNLGAMIAYELAEPLRRSAYIVNPVSIDEIEDIARVSGLKGIERTSVFHVLNQKAIAKRHAKAIGSNYEDLNLIVCHLGGGISCGLHKHGRVVDVNNALGGDGPFSPERTGTLPTYPLIDLCFSGKHTKEEVKKMLVGHGGLYSYLGTSDGYEVQRRIESGDEEAKFYFEAMAYGVVKEIGSLYFIARGKVDGVLLTGGLAHNQIFTDYIKHHISPIVSLYIYPGEDEMRALAEGTLSVLLKQEKLQVY